MHFGAFWFDLILWMIIPEKTTATREPTRKKQHQVLSSSEMDFNSIERERMYGRRTREIEQQKKRSHLQMYNRALGSIANR